MALETATYINGLNVANPAGTDQKSTADDHLRLIKSTIKATFPNINAAVTPTPTELNRVAGVTSGIQAQIDAIALTISDAISAAGVKPGSLEFWPSTTPKAGYLLCDGASLSTTTYAALFAVIGYTNGGSGSSFNLPDSKNRVLIGAGGDFVVGAKGGSKDAVVVSHTHTATVTDPGHAHGIATSSPIDRSGGTYQMPGAGNSAYSETSTTGVTVSNSTTGVSGVDANLPPYLAMHLIIKT